MHARAHMHMLTHTHLHTQTELPIYHKVCSRGMIKEEDENTLDEKGERGNISGESYRSLNNEDNKIETHICRVSINLESVKR